MSVWADIGGAICVAATAVGLIFTYLIWRKQGAGRGMRAAAWSLLPLAAYLTGAVGLLGRMVNAVVIFAGSFVFSPKAWAGIIVVGISALLFLGSGGLPLLNWRKARARRKAAKEAKAARDGQVEGTGRGEVAAPQQRSAPVSRGSDDDDMKDIQEILRRRGIS
ncbi:MAG TPA: cellulose synthase [Streptosporangiaceae bacterium]|nr:cellulose synthase [Streptosporangiaceae bacterium]